MYVCMYIFIVYDKGLDWVVDLKSVENVITLGKLIGLLLPSCASEQGNIIRSVRIYIYMCVYKKKNCN